MTDPVAARLAAQLGPWLAEQRGDDATVVELRRIATGNSRANWYLELSDGSRYVVRIEQGGVFGSSSVDEFRFMHAAGSLGCPVAPVRWLDAAGEVTGQPLFVMDFLPGAAAGRDDRSMSPELADDFVAALHRLHATQWSGALSADVSEADATHVQIDRWYSVYRSATDITDPLLEEGAAWLHHHAPPLRRLSIVHGDPGPGNFVHDGTRVTAFTDWEFTHIGDADEDWAYLITMRGSRTMRPDEWLALFERVAGVQLAPATLHYWSVYNYFKGACANLTCRRAFAMANPAPNMAIIGTALHQSFVRSMASLIDEHDRTRRGDADGGQ
jgi:aminoglycoside phosphotransferase (APT) family kinase protein